MEDPNVSVNYLSQCFMHKRLERISQPSHCWACGLPHGACVSSPEGRGWHETTDGHVAEPVHSSPWQRLALDSHGYFGGGVVVVVHKPMSDFTLGTSECGRYVHTFSRLPAHPFESQVEVDPHWPKL
jgi:hypothetical protein